MHYTHVLYSVSMVALNIEAIFPQAKRKCMNQRSGEIAILQML